MSVVALKLTTLTFLGGGREKYVNVSEGSDRATFPDHHRPNVRPSPSSRKSPSRIATITVQSLYSRETPPGPVPRTHLDDSKGTRSTTRFSCLANTLSFLPRV